jgi:hypothetical protein
MGMINPYQLLSFYLYLPENGFDLPCIHLIRGVAAKNIGHWATIYTPSCLFPTTNPQASKGFSPIQ